MEGKVYSGVATMRRLPKFECLFFKHEVILWSSFANESCEFSEPTLVSLLLVAIPQAVGSCVCLCVYVRVCVCVCACVCVCLWKAYRLQTFDIHSIHYIHSERQRDNGICSCAGCMCVGV